MFIDFIPKVCYNIVTKKEREEHKMKTTKTINDIIKECKENNWDYDLEESDNIAVYSEEFARLVYYPCGMVEVEVFAKTSNSPIQAEYQHIVTPHGLETIEKIYSKK